jgi:hypothetical protein
MQSFAIMSVPPPIQNNKKETERQRVLRLAAEIRKCELHANVQSFIMQDFADQQLRLLAEVAELRQQSNCTNTRLDTIMQMLGVAPN